MKYSELKNRQQAEVNDLPIAFAFSNEQFNQGMEQLGLKPTETDKVYSLGAGGFYRRSDAEMIHAVFKRHEQERQQAMATDDQFLKSMFFYELCNHEYGFTEDVTDALDALGLDYGTIQNDPRMKNALELACTAARKTVYG